MEQIWCKSTDNMSGRRTKFSSVDVLVAEKTQKCLSSTLCFSLGPPKTSSTAKVQEE